MRGRSDSCPQVTLSLSMMVFSPAPDQTLALPFPAFLINPNLKHPTHLPTSSPNYQPKSDNHQIIRPIGRRRKQRSENAQFSSNPHVCRPETSDYQLWNSNLQEIRFTIPPPRGYPSSLYIPPAEPIPADPFSSTMGAFNRSLKGVRKSIRPLIRNHHQSQDNPGPVEEMISKIDHHLSTWINSHTVWKSTEIDHSHRIIDPNLWPPPSDPIRNQPIPLPNPQPSIVEISRSPYVLNWHVPSPFSRYLVHCIARYYGIVSFSCQRSIIQSNHNHHDKHDQREWEERRIVCMVKAHFPPSRESRRINGHQTLDTPPATDLDSEVSAVEVMSEIDSVPTTDDDQQISEPTPRPKSRFLFSINEQKETDEHQIVDPDLDNQQQQTVVENSKLKLTPLINNSSDSSFLPKTATTAKDNNSNALVPQNNQSNQTPSFLSPHNALPSATHTHQVPHENKNKNKKSKAFITSRSDPSINFLDWIRRC